MTIFCMGALNLKLRPCNHAPRLLYDDQLIIGDCSASSYAWSCCFLIARNQMLHRPINRLFFLYRNPRESVSVAEAWLEAKAINYISSITNITNLATIILIES